jgi:transposase
MRDLTRAREAAVEDLRRKRQQISAFLLRQGLHYSGGRAWTKSHRNWLASQKLEDAEQRIAFEGLRVPKITVQYQCISAEIRKSFLLVS